MTKRYRLLLASACVLPLLLFLVGDTTGLLAAKATTSAHPPLVLLSQRDVTYPGVHGVTLAGTLLIPAHPRGTRVPGVVIVAGSGSIDRNGNELEVGYVSDLYKQLAESLAQHGIASLRYDKRGVGARSPVPLPKDPAHPTAAEIAAVQQFGKWDNYIGDATATLNYLQHRPEIDSHRTVLLGHSEGTNISEQIASSPRHLTHPPAALVLIGAPGRTLDVVVREQLLNNFIEGGLSSALTDFILAQYDALIMGIKQEGQILQAPLENLATNNQVPASITVFFKSFFSVYNLLYLEDQLRLNPPAILRQYRGPVLIIQGESDQQIFANEDTPLLQAALQSRPHPNHYRILLVPDASHDLKYVPPGSTGGGVTGPVVPEATDVLNSWLKHTLYH
ncbi:MAG TPA: alpha/beta fold hydrolase [Ktedonobacteraceae bacterium]|nr:alpha/beta fold hydrolase [Ktedonobacteraceae bacterium]